MGTDTYDLKAVKSYITSKGRTIADDGSIVGHYTAQQMFVNTALDPALNPYNVMRESCDCETHPRKRPVILALDVTGSMGPVSVQVAKKLTPIMTHLFAEVPDIEFMTMAIGDLATDKVPIQISQFETDVRISEQLDKVYFEGKGGGNGYESYTAAWYMALHHTKMDCLKRGYKPLIITLGDEPLNPYLPHIKLNKVTGDHNETGIETDKLYEEASKVFDIHHIGIGGEFRYHEREIKNTWGKLLGERYHVANLDNLDAVITDIVLSKYRLEELGGTADGDEAPTTNTNGKGEITW